MLLLKEMQPHVDPLDLQQYICLLLGFIAAVAKNASWILQNSAMENVLIYSVAQVSQKDCPAFLDQKLKYI